jgi:lysozyme
MMRIATVFLVAMVFGQLTKKKDSTNENMLIETEEQVVRCDTSIVPTKAVDTRDMYQLALGHLKEYEGFRSEVYIDVDGSKTLGYGHHLLPGEDFVTISEKQATNLLIRDLNLRIQHVESTYSLTGNQALALGLFAFNAGTGNLKKAVDNGLLGDINRLLQYCHYRVKINGKRVMKTSKKLLERRQFEVALYKSSIPSKHDNVDVEVSFKN